jgi:hypothetical protein
MPQIDEFILIAETMAKHGLTHVNYLGVQVTRPEPKPIQPIPELPVEAPIPIHQLIKPPANPYVAIARQSDEALIDSMWPDHTPVEPGEEIG